MLVRIARAPRLLRTTHGLHLAPLGGQRLGVNCSVAAQARVPGEFLLCGDGRVLVVCYLLGSVIDLAAAAIHAAGALDDDAATLWYVVQVCWSARAHRAGGRLGAVDLFSRCDWPLPCFKRRVGEMHRRVFVGKCHGMRLTLVVTLVDLPGPVSGAVERALRSYAVCDPRSSASPRESGILQPKQRQAPARSRCPGQPREPVDSDGHRERDPAAPACDGALGAC
jgi:hypothetical protein